MASRDEQQARYWLTEKGWAAALCVSRPPSTTPAQTADTEPQEQPHHD